MERLEDTVARLRNLLEDGVTAAGGRMPPERKLAGDLGIGRRSLRRALEVLEREGRITREQGRGTFLRQDGARPVALDRIAEHTSPPEVIELRLALEPIVARLAAVRASPCEIRTLLRLAEETRQAKGAEEYERADAAFHRAVVEAAHNALFMAVFDAVGESRRDIGWQRLGENGRCYKRQSTFAEYHGEIASAIAARDADRAGKAMYAHLREVQQHINQHAFLPTSEAAE
ncbi:MAG: GntR family transcriptional regulator [Rhodospirillales bacterium]|jgi:DNA-binding FadR family transcriptional regulator|nr:GntR family transcriptional regulator [Rhodospirillales bacterium]